MTAVFEQLLTPAQVADMFGVAAQTVRRWTDEGRLTDVRTPGGQRRLRPDEVRELAALHPPRRRPAGLTERQAQVAEFAAANPQLDCRGLGKQLGLSRDAVQCALSRAYQVLGIGRRAELARALGAA